MRLHSRPRNRRVGIGVGGGRPSGERERCMHFRRLGIAMAMVQEWLHHIGVTVSRARHMLIIYLFNLSSRSCPYQIIFVRYILEQPGSYKRISKWLHYTPHNYAGKIKVRALFDPHKMPRIPEAAGTSIRGHACNTPKPWLYLRITEWRWRKLLRPGFSSSFLSSM